MHSATQKALASSPRSIRALRVALAGLALLLFPLVAQAQDTTAPKVFFPPHAGKTKIVLTFSEAVYFQQTQRIN